MDDVLCLPQYNGSMISLYLRCKSCHFLLQIVSIFLFGASLLNGQSKNKDEESLLRVNFSVFSFERLSGVNYLEGDLSAGVPLKFYSSDRSPIYNYEGQNPIVFFRETLAPTEIDPSAVKRVKVAEITIPKPGGDYLFIFFQNPDSKAESYRIFPLEDSLSTLPYGSVRFFNATKHQLIGKLDKKNISIGLGPSKVYRLKGSSHSLDYGFEHDGKFHLSYQGPFQLSEDMRGIFMLSPPYIKGSALLQTRFLIDRRLSEEVNKNFEQLD